MALNEPKICLYFDDVANIQTTIEIGKKASYNRIISRITSPKLSHRDGNSIKNQVLTRSDLLLSAEQWRNNTVLKVSEFGDCDSRNKTVQKQSQQNLKDEIDWAIHLDSIACIIITLCNDESFNLARQMLDNFDQTGCVLTEMSIIDKSFFTQNYSPKRNAVGKSMASAMVWRRWNKFRLATEFNRHFKVCFFFFCVAKQETETFEHGDIYNKYN